MNKELLKGTTEVMVLKMLEKEPMYGYGIIKNFDLLSKGTFKFKEGTLYPLLHTLEKKKYIESYWDSEGGRRRKYYKITKKGLGELALKEEEWRMFSKTVNGVLSL